MTLRGRERPPLTTSSEPKRVVRESAEQTREAWHSLPDRERLPAKIRERLEDHQARIKLP